MPNVFTWTGVCFCNAAFVDAVNDFDGAKRFYLCSLSEDLCGFGVFDTLQDVDIDAVLMFSY